MRRIAGAVAALLAAMAAVAAMLGTPARSADTYRVDAIFDTAKGIIPGQLVKIAGARVGTIDDVRLTRDYKARIVMAVPRRFTFHEDAGCNIQPEGLISENFVQCDPGTPDKAPLRGRGDLPPTVPVERTMVPVSFTDLFRIFQADVRQRFTVTMAAIGGGLAARGEELNDVIRRANPTLAALRRLSDDLAAQRAQIAAAVRDTDAVLAGLAPRGDRVADFIRQARRVSDQTADHRSELAEAVRRLPGLLDATDEAIDELDRLAVNGRPLLGRLRAAAPGLTRVVDQIGPFAAAGRPALRRLGRTAAIGSRTATAARPVVAQLRTFAGRANPVGRLLATLLNDLRDRGFVENLNLFAYHVAAATARYDATSHILPAHLILSACSNYSSTPTADCNAFFGERAVARTAPKRSARPAAPRATPTPAAAAPRPQATATPKPRLPVEVLELLKPVENLTKQITDDLKKTLPKPLQHVLSDPTPDRRALEDLTDLLFGP